jgi:hypothetical protein
VTKLRPYRFLRDRIANVIAGRYQLEWATERYNDREWDQAVAKADRILARLIPAPPDKCLTEEHMNALRPLSAYLRSSGWYQSADAVEAAIATLDALLPPATLQAIDNARIKGPKP